MSNETIKQLILNDANPGNEEDALILRHNPEVEAENGDTLSVRIAYAEDQWMTICMKREQVEKIQEFLADLVKTA